MIDKVGNLDRHRRQQDSEIGFVLAEEHDGIRHFVPEAGQERQHDRDDEVIRAEEPMRVAHRRTRHFTHLERGVCDFVDSHVSLGCMQLEYI